MLLQQNYKNFIELLLLSQCQSVLVRYPIFTTYHNFQRKTPYVFAKTNKCTNNGIFYNHIDCKYIDRQASQPRKLMLSSHSHTTCYPASLEGYICTDLEQEKEGTIMQTNIRFDLRPKQRPKLAEEIATALRAIPCYQKVPSMAYKIGDCTLEKDGTLRIPDTVDPETIERLLSHLADKGFTGSTEQTEDRLIITVPKNTFTELALANLQKMVDNKEALFSKAFVKENLTLNIDAENVRFDWFQFTANPDEVSAYTEFVSRLCDLARKVKRVVPTATENDNDKYAFRCFLLRLGFIGERYKKARKVLLKRV